MNPQPQHSLRYELRPRISEADLEPLFAEAWGQGAAKGYDRVLPRSLSYIGAFRDTELVGFVNVGWDGNAHAFILDTIVHTAWRRQGIGLELVQRAIAVAREAGVEWLHVDYEPHLDEFYRKAGLQETKARLLHLKSQP